MLYARARRWKKEVNAKNRRFSNLFLFCTLQSLPFRRKTAAEKHSLSGTSRCENISFRVKKAKSRIEVMDEKR